MTASTTTSQRPVPVALVGFGYWGRNLARNVMASANLELVAVAESDLDAREAAARAVPTARVYANYDDVLDDPAVEGILVAAPASLHASIAAPALESGRHVFVEKPLATSVEDAQLLTKLADRQQRILMVGHTFLYAAPVQRLRNYITNGELGAVQYLYSQRLSLGRIRRDCNALWNFGPHDVSIMLYLLGERPVEVSARSFSFIGKGIDDVCFASLTFESGVVGNFQCSWIDPRKVRLVTVVGDRKMAVYDDVSADQKLQIADAGVARKPERSFGEFDSLGDFQWRTRVGDVLVPHIALTEPLLVEMEAFGTACLTGDAPPTSGQQGCDVVRILTALDESAARRGAAVEIDW